MAEQLKPGDAKPKELTDADYRAAVDEINATKEQASEYQGAAAKLTKDFADKHDLDKKALTFIAQLAKRSDRQSAMGTLREVVVGARRYGFFDQVDAFADADLISVMRGIVAEADRGADMTQAGVTARDDAEGQMAAE